MLVATMWSGSGPSRSRSAADRRRDAARRLRCCKICIGIVDLGFCALAMYVQARTNPISASSWSRSSSSRRRCWASPAISPAGLGRCRDAGQALADGPPGCSAACCCSACSIMAHTFCHICNLADVSGGYRRGATQAPAPFGTWLRRGSETRGFMCASAATPGPDAQSVFSEIGTGSREERVKINRKKARAMAIVTLPPRCFRRWRGPAAAFCHHSAREAGAQRARGARQTLLLIRAIAVFVCIAAAFGAVAP